MMKDKLPANHLPAWRKRAGFTQAQIEKMLSWPHGRLSHLENGSAHLTQDVLDVLGPIYAKEASNLLEPPPAAPVYQSQPPRRRKKDSPTLADGVAMLQQLMDELEIMRVAHAEQLDRLGKQVKQAAITISEAIQDTDAMTERWQQDLAVLRQTVRPHLKKSNANDD
jgi:transcriptional regulator with XRE-family HTH domain